MVQSLQLFQGTEADMAGDWIKMEIDLHEKPEVVAIATELNIDIHTVVGRLHRIWGWFSKHTTNGRATSATPALLDSLVSATGFAQAMTSVGWLEVGDGHVVIPKFDRHNSKSAKKRSLNTERQSRYRNASVALSALPEKRREEKRKILAADAAEPVVDEAKEHRRAMQVHLVEWAWPGVEVPPSSWAKAGESAKSLYADGVRLDELKRLTAAYWPGMDKTPSGVHQRVAELRKRAKAGDGEDDRDRVMRLIREGVL